MLAIPLILLFVLGPPRPTAPQSDHASQQDLAKGKAEAYRQAAIHVNELAGNIRSEGDARNFIDAVAEQFSNSRYQFWMSTGIRDRVARAEYEAVYDSTLLIPEQRIVAVWNEYVREIDAPGEALVTVTEVHNMRDAMYTTSKIMWKKQMQWLWTMPGIYAVGADGKIASGCRAVETARILYDMFRFPENVRSARKRVGEGVLLSDVIKRQPDAAPRSQRAKSRIEASTPNNPVISAEYRYVQAHGDGDYQRLLERLSEELFPAE